MGYSHYFAYDPRAESFIAAWPRMVADASRIAAHVENVLRIRLAGGAGEGRPEIDERRIWLNGPADEDLAHDTFLIDPALAHSGERDGLVSDCCKTQRMPYDIAVTSILLRCRHLAPDAFVIGSDGDWEREWRHGAMYWAPGCERGPAPLALVAALFAQVERRSDSPLTADAWDGPASAQRARVLP